MRRQVRTLIGLSVIVAGATSFGCVTSAKRSPVYLVIDSLGGQRGGASGTFTSPLTSDVLTLVSSPAPCTPAARCPMVFSDPGQVTLRAEMRNLNSLTEPTATSAVTLTRYRVTYRLASGPGTPGVDVPFAFDGATTGTVRVGAATTLPFELVQIPAKQRSPLVGGAFITSIAEVTFYGMDQAGNDVSVTGLIQIDFGDFGDF